MEVWIAGNATSNNDLIGACIPRIACDFERLASSQRFFQHVGVERFQLLLQSPWICDRNEATKFKALRTWFHASSLNYEHIEHEKNLLRLLELINLNKLPRGLIVETSIDGSNFNLSEDGRKTPIYVHAHKEDSRTGALETVPELSGGKKLCFPLVLRLGSCTVALDGCVYTLGGQSERDSGESTSIVERINPLNGEVTELQPMIEERDCHSAVARDHAILVFGGYNLQSDTILDSCEEFTPATNTWRQLPKMPTPRSSTGAAHIPGVGEIVVGGCIEIEDGRWMVVDNAEIYLTNSSPLGYASSWCEITPMLNKRSIPSAEFFNGKVYVAGYSDSVEMLSIFTEGPPQWTNLTNTSFSPCSMVSLEGSLLFGADDGRIYELLFKQDTEVSFVTCKPHERTSHYSSPFY
nr:kelch 18 [Hymenolepis microstoma]